MWQRLVRKEKITPRGPLILLTHPPQVAGSPEEIQRERRDLVTEWKSGGSLAAGITPSGPVISQQSPETERNIGEMAR